MFNQMRFSMHVTTQDLIWTLHYVAMIDLTDL